jgi:hypothetical protein
MLTRDAAGWMRCCSSSKSSLGWPSGSRRISTSSPSIAHRAGNCLRACSTTSGK